MRAVLSDGPSRGLVIADDLLTSDIPVLRTEDTVQRALALVALQHVEVIPIVSARGEFAGLLDRRAILGAYRRCMAELRNGAR